MTMVSHRIETDTVYPEHSLGCPGKVIFVGHHLSTGKQITCIIRAISLAGATLEIDPEVKLPDNFFLEIFGIRDEIGATVVKREGGFTVISFNMLLNSDFLHHVLRLSFESME
ncbi:hypothetical protein [Oryzifoliimicrobium ureilyticus]|uniref:hypothetical protein n=1 Tax=Oryzifoliimicrobium ureilyticus TaxID=3113724 RepID=UPI003F66C57D